MALGRQAVAIYAHQIDNAIPIGEAKRTGLRWVHIHILTTVDACVNVLTAIDVRRCPDRGAT